MEQHFYRYMDASERQFVEAYNCIASRSGATWYAVAPPSLYTNKGDVKRLLATPNEKLYRFGPLLQQEVPEMDFSPVATVIPQRLPDGSWASGGGLECATTKPCWLQGFTMLED